MVIARAFEPAGADLIDVSAGQTSIEAKPVYGRMFQTPFADRIRNEVGVATMAVGNITEPDHVNSIIAAGRADLCALARPHLSDPNFALHAAAELGYAGQCVAETVSRRQGAIRANSQAGQRHGDHHMTPPRRALVTGGAKGIGVAIARRLAHEGAQLALLGRDRVALQAAARELDAAYEVADVTRPEMLAAAIAQLGPFDILVNNAGAASSQPFVKSTPQDWAAMIAVNLTSTFAASTPSCRTCSRAAGDASSISPAPRD